MAHIQKKLKKKTSLFETITESWDCVGENRRAKQDAEETRAAAVLCARLPVVFSPWTATRQAPLSMGFSRQSWDGLPCPAPGDLPNPGTKPALMLPALAGGFFTTSTTKNLVTFDVGVTTQG